MPRLANTDEDFTLGGIPGMPRLANTDEDSILCAKPTVDCLFREEKLPTVQLYIENWDTRDAWN